MKNPQLFSRLALLSLALAWAFDLLFWGREPGLSFPLFVTLCLAVGIYLTLSAGERPPLASLILLVPVLLFAGFTTVRAEPFTRFVFLALALGGMALLAMTWLGGSWTRYRVVDWVANGLRLAGGVLVRPLAQLGSRSDAPGEKPQEASPAGGQWRPLLSVGLGLLLALPVLGILGSLLVAADPIFGQELKRFLNLEHLDEYVVRLGYILIGAYLLAGIFLYALLSSREERAGDGEPSVPAFLGWVEAVTLLGAVNLLFAAFTAVQFRYFFGGQANIRLDGYTYAEYARQGFGELCAAAAISLLLFLTLSAVTRREGAPSRRLFSTLGVLLVAFVGVILVSAFQRLALYEAAYGFSRIRTYTHVFILVLAGLLLATIGLEMTGRLRYFVLAAIVAAVSFGLALGLLNVDSWIVRQNVARTLQGEELDAPYLMSLSEDATPALFQRFDDPALPAQTHDLIGGVLACRAKLAGSGDEEADWRSYHFSTAAARRLYLQRAGDLSRYPLHSVDRGWFVTVNQEEIPCGWVD